MIWEDHHRTWDSTRLQAKHSSIILKTKYNCDLTGVDMTSAQITAISGSHNQYSYMSIPKEILYLLKRGRIKTYFKECVIF